MSIKAPAEKKSTVIPGYAGYRPGIAQNTHLANTVAEQAREVFNPQKLDTHQNAFSSTGFNATLIPKTD